MKKRLSKDLLHKIEVLSLITFLVHIGILISRSKGATTPLTWQYVARNPLQGRSSFAYRTFAEIPIIYSVMAVVILFFLLMLFKLRVYRKAVQADNKSEMSRFRWYELGLGGSFLAVLATQLGGGYNPAIHIAILSAGIIFATTGSRIEVAQKNGTAITKQQKAHLLLSKLIILIFMIQQVVATFINNTAANALVYQIAGVAAGFWLLQSILIIMSFRKPRVSKKTKKPRSKASFVQYAVMHRLVSLAAVAAATWLVLTAVS